MDQADAQQAAIFFDPKALCQIQRVVISVPSENAAVTEEFSAFERTVISEAHADGGHALLETRRVGNSVEAQARNDEQSANHLLGEIHFVLAHDAMSGHQGRAAIGDSGITFAAEFSHVVNRCSHAREAFVNLRSGLPAIRQSFGSGPNFVGTEAHQQVAFAVNATHVWAEEFIWGTGQEVAIERAHVNDAMRSVMDGVNKGKRSGIVREMNDFADWINGTNGVGSVADGDELGA